MPIAPSRLPSTEDASASRTGAGRFPAIQGASTSEGRGYAARLRSVPTGVGLSLESGFWTKRALRPANPYRYPRMAGDRMRASSSPLEYPLLSIASIIPINHRQGPLDSSVRATLISIEIKSQSQLQHQGASLLMASSNADAVSSDQIICRCLRVFESELVEALSTEEICDLNDVRRRTGAGSGCTACHRRIKEYLNKGRLYSCSSSSVPPSCSER
jgi:bacterioferritin-associated ferredoxin